MGMYIGTTPVDKVFISMTPTLKKQIKNVTCSTYVGTTITFTGLTKEPCAFVLRLKDTLSTASASYFFILEVQYDGTNVKGSYYYAQGGYLEDTTHYSFTYNNGTLTISSSGTYQSYGGAFWSGTYELTAFYF